MSAGKNRLEKSLQSVISFRKTRKLPNFCPIGILKFSNFKSTRETVDEEQLEMLNIDCS